MRETGDVAGLQVHRSHWAATCSISPKQKRDGDKALLTLVGCDAYPAGEPQSHQRPERRGDPAACEGVQLRGIAPARQPLVERATW